MEKNSNDESDVDIFAIPQATFAFKVNKPIVIPEEDGKHTYKIQVDKFTIIDDKGKEIPGRIEYDRSADVAEFVSDDILPPNKKLKVITEVSFLEKKNGTYQVLKVDGKKATEREERSFVTGTAPNYIPSHNILYSYPVMEQKNYYLKESNVGYIQLKRGQDYLFDDVKWQTFVSFSQGEESLDTNFDYDESSNKVHFNIP